MNVGDLHKVWEIKALKRKPGEEQAHKMLEKIAKQVQPIMHKHKWRVKLLSEFYPNNPSLLGLNVGAGIQVKLRLRRPNRDSDFYPYDQVLDTMLHELCHNAHGPHNSSFYKLWDELRKECEELMSKGITGSGEGFDLPGRRLGGYSRQPPLSSLRKTALSAAEKRSKLGSLLPSGPNRIGGDSVIMKALTPVQAAAMAAERRLQDDLWCGSQSCNSSDHGDGDYEPAENPVNKQMIVGSSKPTENSNLALDPTSRKRSRDHGDGNYEPAENPVNKQMIVGSSKPTENSNLALDPTSRKRSRGKDSSLPLHSSSNHKFVDLTLDTPEKGCVNENQTGSQRRNFGFEIIPYSQPSSQAGSTSNLSSSSGSLSGDNRTLHSEENAMWQCLTCTLLNRSLAPICELCGTQQPRDVTTKHNTWSCKFCTLENSAKLERCSACDQWRYSNGPNLGP